MIDETEPTWDDVEPVHPPTTLREDEIARRKLTGLLLLDVDGVLNPLSTDREWLAANGYERHWLRPTGSSQVFRVALNPGWGQILLRAAEFGEMELAWATTWEDDANRLIGPLLGLPELPVIRFGDDLHRRTVWKARAVGEYAKDRDLVWLDDDFVDHVGPLRELRIQRQARGLSTALVEVDCRTGLQAKHVKRAIDHSPRIHRLAQQGVVAALRGIVEPCRCGEDGAMPR